VAAFILSLIAYKQRLLGHIDDREAKYWEQFNWVPAGTWTTETWSTRMPDGTMSSPYQKSPQAEWHEQKKWEYQGAVMHINRLLLAVVVGLPIFGSDLKVSGTVQ
jgi:hypothetical protein